MSPILQSLQFAAQDLNFHNPAQLEYRAKLVEANFKAIGLKHRIACQLIPVPGWRGVPADLGNPAGKSFDWQVKLLSAGVTLNLKVKRRPGDLGRSIGVPT